MIQGVFGLPRSGKSTYLARLAKKGFKKYERVYSNFYIKGCYQLDFDTLGKVEYKNCLILIDEISLFCDCRSYGYWYSGSIALLLLEVHRKWDIHSSYRSLHCYHTVYLDFCQRGMGT